MAIPPVGQLQELGSDEQYLHAEEQLIATAIFSSLIDEALMPSKSVQHNYKMFPELLHQMADTVELQSKEHLWNGGCSEL